MGIIPGPPPLRNEPLPTWARDRLAVAVRAVGARCVARLNHTAPILAGNVEDAIAGHPLDGLTHGWLLILARSVSIDVWIACSSDAICFDCGTPIATSSAPIRPTHWQTGVQGRRERHTRMKCDWARVLLEWLARGYDGRHDVFSYGQEVIDARALLARLTPRPWTPPRWWRDARPLRAVVEGELPPEGEAPTTAGVPTLRVLRGGR